MKAFLSRAEDLTPKIVGVAGWIILVAGLKLGKEIFVTFASAALLSVILSPMVTLLKKGHVPKVVAVFLVVLLGFGLLGGVGYVLVGQGALIGRNLPEYRKNLQEKLTSFSQGVKDVQQAVKELTAESPPPSPSEPSAKPSGKPNADKGTPTKVELVESSPTPLSVLSNAVVPFMGVLGSTAAVILLVLFFLIYSGDIHDRVVHVAGSGRGTVAAQAISDSMKGVVRYLSLQAVINICHGTLVTIGLWAMGVPNALLWGFIGGLLRFVPYLGPVVGCLLPVAFTIAVAPGWSRPLWVAGFVVGLEALTGNVVEPLVYGRRTGLSPAAIMVSAVFWSWLWDGTGLLLSVPLTVCLLAMGKQIPQLQVLEVLLGEGSFSEPKVQVYLRLLSNNQVEAAEMIETESQGKSLVDIYDSLLLPLLQMVESDLKEGKIDENKGLRLIGEIRDLATETADTAEESRSNAAEATPTGSSGLPEVSVLCLPASDGTDELAASMLARLLTADHYLARALPAETLAGEKLEVIGQERADIIVISALPPTNVLRARYLYKRLRARFPELPILVGIWGSSDTMVLGQRIASDRKAKAVGSLAMARAALREMVENVRLRKADAGPFGGPDVVRQPG